MEQKKNNKKLMIIIAILVVVIVALVGVVIFMVGNEGTGESKQGTVEQKQGITQNKIKLTEDNILDYLNIEYMNNTYQDIFPNNAIPAKFSDIGFDIYPINGIRFQNLKIKLAMETKNTLYTLCNIKNKNKAMQGTVSEDELDDIIYYEIELPTNGTFCVEDEFVVFSSSLTAPNSPFSRFYVDSVSGYVVVEE